MSIYFLVVSIVACALESLSGGEEFRLLIQLCRMSLGPLNAKDIPSSKLKSAMQGLQACSPGLSSLEKHGQ